MAWNLQLSANVSSEPTTPRSSDASIDLDEALADSAQEDSHYLDELILASPPTAQSPPQSPGRFFSPRQCFGYREIDSPRSEASAEHEHQDGRDRRLLSSRFDLECEQSDRIAELENELSVQLSTNSRLESQVSVEASRNKELESTIACLRASHHEQIEEWRNRHATAEKTADAYKSRHAQILKEALSDEIAYNDSLRHLKESFSLKEEQGAQNIAALNVKLNAAEDSIEKQHKALHMLNLNCEALRHEVSATAKANKDSQLREQRALAELEILKKSLSISEANLEESRLKKI